MVEVLELTESYNDFKGTYAQVHEVIKRNKWGKDSDNVRFLRNVIGIKSFCLEKSILDVCCGTGEDLFELSKQLGNGYKYTGIDISEDMLLQAVSKYPEMDFKKCSAYELESLGKKFSFVYCLASIYLFDDHEKALNSMSKVVNKNGLLIFDFYNKRAFFDKDKDRIEPREKLEYNGVSIERVRSQKLVGDFVEVSYHYWYDGKEFDVFHRDRLMDLPDLLRILKKDFKLVMGFNGYSMSSADITRDKYVSLILEKK